MFYKYFKKELMKLGDQFLENDRPRLYSQIFPKDVVITSGFYSEDKHELKQYNLYKCNKFQGKNPLIICIHGGAWIYGDKDLNSYFCCYLAQKGFDVIAMSYRLVPEVNIEGIQKDIFESLHYFKNNKDTLGINFDNVFFTGESAGGQLVVTTSAILRNKELACKLGIKLPDIKVKAICSNHGVCFLDIAGRIKDHNYLTKIAVEGMKRILFSKHYEKNLWYQNIANPTLYIKNKHDIPPIMIVTSFADFQYYYQSEMLKDYLESINLPFVFYNETAEEAEHVFNVYYPYIPLSAKCNDRIVQFFKNLIE